MHFSAGPRRYGFLLNEKNPATRAKMNAPPPGLAKPWAAIGSVRIGGPQALDPPGLLHRLVRKGVPKPWAQNQAVWNHVLGLASVIW